MRHPLLYEINTRCWLRELSERAGRAVTLASVPEEEFARWERFHFTHLWLMGVWTTGPKTRTIAQAAFHHLAQEYFPGSADSEILSSPYAIAEYRVAKELGGPAGLQQFRQRLREHGIRLMLDFVPNHVGLDHPWLVHRPALFVQSEQQRPETFPIETAAGPRWIAHGKDPYFPAWSDTAQLDYRLSSTRAAMMEVLQSVANQCDGVRCDMAMLALDEIMAKTWSHFPCPGDSRREFWPEAISAVKESHRGFIFTAEVYWNLEEKLQEMGFDYTYDKIFYDYLIRKDHSALQRHLQATAQNFRMVRFLENHDEPRIAAHLSLEEQKAAAVLLLAQPGMRLIYDGQIEGRRLRTPVQLARYLPETGHPEIAAFYEELLTRNKLIT
ncbi:MAG TPA: alpha-amylase family glycosyl hydrolase [Candidatus Saccharimonadales bacterium]|nr:alpha-amylase family glycosyl hydrolase [Candidatus Saccharimonadales bacterium]